MIFFFGETVWMLDSSLMVLYTKDRYNWDQKTLMDYNSYNFGLIVIGQFVCFPFLVKIVKLPVMLIGCLTCVSRAGYYSMLAICQRWKKKLFLLKKTLLICLLSGWCASFSPLANILCGVQSIVYRSSLSLLLPPKELGSVFAMLEILVALVPFLVTPIATWLYNFTLTTFPGTFCEFSKLFLFSITYLFRKLDSC